MGCILYVNDGVEAYICKGYEAINQESDLAKDLMKNHQQCLPVVRHVAQGRPSDSRYWDQGPTRHAIYATLVYSVSRRWGCR